MDGQGWQRVRLMAQHGWSDRTMVTRYIDSAREQLAHAEYDRIFGDR